MRRKKYTPRQLADLEEEILTLVQQGHNQTSACKIAGVSRPWLYKRKETNTNFGDRLNQLLTLSPAEYEESKKLVRQQWMEKFVEEFVNSGGQKKVAAAAVNKSMIEVMSYLNPLHPLYDENFKERLGQAEVVVTEIMLDEARRRGMDSSNQMLVQCLQWLDPDRFVVDKKGSNSEIPFQVNITLSSEERSRELLNSMVIDGRVTEDSRNSTKQIGNGTGGCLSPTES